MTEFEKQVYNTHLIVSRAINNKPFRLREDFYSFESNPEYLYVKKMASFFKKHKHLNMKSFFEAPYFLYNEKYFSLEFYCTYKAVSTYTKYNENFLIENPDNKIVGEKIKESIKFISSFCKDKKIKLNEYINYKDSKTDNYSFLTHLKNRKINIFILFAFDKFDSVNRSINFNIKQLIAPQLIRIDYIRAKLYSSDIMKKNINLIKKYVDNR